MKKMKMQSELNVMKKKNGNRELLNRELSGICVKVNSWNENVSAWFLLNLMLSDFQFLLNMILIEENNC